VGEGTTFAEISKSALAKIEIPFPNSLLEQSTIAEVLIGIDITIQTTEQLLGKYEQVSVGLMQDLFTRGVDKKGVVRSTKENAFVRSELGLIPESWRVATLGELFEQRVQRGRVGLPVMSIVMNDGLVERSSVDRRVESALPPERHALVIKGDIAYNMMRMWQGVLGRASVDCLVSPAYVVLKPKSGIDSSFAEWLFRDKRTILKFRRASRGVVDDRLRLYPGDLFAIKVSVPESLEEQRLIAGRLDAFRLKINQERYVLSLYRRLRAGLMQDLLTGKKRVTALLDQEPRREKVYA
jgi:type I restriction enzyme, S subunit